MFTGIIEEMGTLSAVKKGSHSAVLTIAAHLVLQDVKIGDSIAVNGVCLTVTSFTDTCFSADVMHETLNRSTLGSLPLGSRVNLERAMAANGRFGGHLVAGHVDGIGKITSIRRDDIAHWYTISADASLLRYLVEKGSVAIDGISLTVASVTSQDFSVSVIPHTSQVTALGLQTKGSTVNLETDIVGKYIEKLLHPTDIQPAGSVINREFLARYDF